MNVLFWLSVSVMLLILYRAYYHIRMRQIPFEPRPKRPEEWIVYLIGTWKLYAILIFFVGCFCYGKVAKRRGSGRCDGRITP